MSSSNWALLQKTLKSEHNQMDMSLFTKTRCAYPAELGAMIASRIINGESVRAIWKDVNEVYPELSHGALYWWLAGGQKGGAAEVLHAHYTRIREAQASRLGQQAIEIIDQQARGEGDFRHARVALEGSKWITARLDKTKWGDNLNVQHSGSVTLQAIVDEAAQQRKSLIDQARGRVIEGETDDSQQLSANEDD